MTIRTTITKLTIECEHDTIENLLQFLTGHDRNTSVHGSLTLTLGRVPELDGTAQPATPKANRSGQKKFSEEQIQAMVDEARATGKVMGTARKHGISDITLRYHMKRRPQGGKPKTPEPVRIVPKAEPTPVETAAAKPETEAPGNHDYPYMCTCGRRFPNPGAFTAHNDQARQTGPGTHHRLARIPRDLAG